MSGMVPKRMTYPLLPHQPLISVLMPAYNAAPFLSKAIGSILNQTYPNWELLILDDGSTDETASIITGLTDVRIRKFKNEENQGYLKSCNILFTEVKGDLVTFLDADDTCISTRFQICVDEMASNREVGFITTNFCKSTVDGTIESNHVGKVDYEKYATDAKYYPLVCCATIFLRFELLQKVGGYHPFFDRIGGEDYHWLFQLARNSVGKHISVVTYNYTSHPNQTHIRNSNPLKYFTEEIDSHIRANILTNGLDLLSKHTDLRSTWDNYIQEHPHELAFQKAASELNQGNWGAALTGTFNIIATAPQCLGAWKRFIFLSYSWSRRLVSSREFKLG